MPSNYNRETPLGLEIIVVLGLPSALLSGFDALALLGRGGLGFVLGQGLLAFIAIRVLILFGLISLSPWAWTAGGAIYTLADLVDLLRVDVLGMLIALVIAGYIYSQKDLFRRH